MRLADDAQHGAPAGRRRRAGAAASSPGRSTSASGRSARWCGRRSTSTSTSSPWPSRAALADGPLPVKRLGEVLTEGFPDVPANALAHLARVAAPLAQLPPRGCWKRPGGVVYQFVDTWLGASARRARPRGDRPPLPRGVRSGLGRRRHRLVRRARHPGRARLDGRPGPPHRRRRQEARRPALRRHRRPETPAPVRLLGLYDNVWLSHAGRDRVTDPAKRKRWMGVNGGLCNTVFVDGWLEGLWRVEDGRPTIVELFRTLSRGEQAELEEELDRGGGAARSADLAGFVWTSSPRKSQRNRRRIGVSGPAGGAGEQGGDGGDAGGRRAQHLGAQPYDVAPAASKAATSSSVRPPSGPTTTTIDAGSAGRRAWPSDDVAASCSTTARSAPRDQRRRRRRWWPARRPRGTTSAATAWRPRAPSNASWPATSRPARPSRPRPTAGGGPRARSRATPISVSTSTASSPRSPFGIAWTTVSRGRGRRRVDHRGRPSP